MPQAKRKKWRQKQNQERYRKQDEQRLHQEIGQKISDEMSPRNNEHYTDYTAFNALTGKECLSKTNLINPQRQVNGSYSN